MPNYQTDRKWSDHFIPTIKQIVGPFLLEPSSLELDMVQATDLMVLVGRDIRIAARVRRPGYSERYPYEFTIRSQRDSGAETELNKIVNGWGDWLFYGHSDSSGTIPRWWLVDLSSFRAALIRRNGSIGINQSNGDGTHFVAFDVRQFPKNPPILVAGSHEPSP